MALVGDRREMARLSGVAPPVVGEFVAGDADEPGDGEITGVAAADSGHRRQERLRCQVFRNCPIATSIEQVVVDLGQGSIEDREDSPRSRSSRRRGTS